MFGFRRRRQKAGPQSTFERIEQILSDDDLQLRALGPKTYSVFKYYSAIDMRPNAEGEFGRTLLNPVPTNGPLGSLVYLSRLQNDNGKQALFHRINCIKGVDVYEHVFLDGRDWGFMFVDMYHSRKSRLAPPGLKLSEEPLQISGVNHYWDDFPFGYAEQKASMPPDIRLLSAPTSAISSQLGRHKFDAPELHIALRNTIAAHTD